MNTWNYINTCTVVCIHFSQQLIILDRHIRIKNHIKQTTPVLVYMYIIIIFVIKITGDLFAVSFPKNTPKNGCHDLGTLLPLTLHLLSLNTQKTAPMYSGARHKTTGSGL